MFLHEVFTVSCPLPIIKAILAEEETPKNQVSEQSCIATDVQRTIGENSVLHFWSQSCRSVWDSAQPAESSSVATEKPLDLFHFHYLQNGAINAFKREVFRGIVSCGQLWC